MDLTQRVDQPEWMDTRVFPVGVMRETLGFLSVTNRFFGGTAVVLRHFEDWSRRWDRTQTIRVLDVGTGGAEIPIALAEWARAKGFQLEVTGIDLVEQAVQVARENSKHLKGIHVERKNLFDINNPGGFDYVIASLLLHHIAPEESVRLLKKIDALAARGILISDLLRSRASYLAVKALSFIIGNPVVRHDGPLSVRRAFRLEELSGLARQADLPYLSARREPWFRVSLAGERP